MQVVVWNQAAEELWGLRSDETIGSVLTSLDMGLPLNDVKPMIGHALVDPDSVGETVVDAVNRRGKQARIRVTCTPFRSSDSVGGAMLLMEVQP
jgi:two-component system CheB/CheR fusion protein